MLRFLSFLFLPKKVYCDSNNTSLCYQCGCSIAVPDAYYSVGLRISYIIAGILIVYARAFLIPNIKGAVIIALFTVGCGFLYEHVVSAVILAFCKWNCFDPAEFDVERNDSYAKKIDYQKWRFLTYGLAIGFLTILLFFY